MKYEFHEDRFQFCPNAIEMCNGKFQLRLWELETFYVD